MNAILRWTIPTVLVACSGRTPINYEVGTAGAVESECSADVNACVESADALWEQRDERDRLVEALDLYEQAYAVDPTNRHVAVRLTRGYYFLGDVFETDDEGRSAQWQTSIEWGGRCIAINEEFTALMGRGDEDERSAIEQTATVDDVPCLYWTATSLGKWARIQGLATLLQHKDTVYKYIQTVERLDPEFYYGAANRYWGAYYAALPSFAGRDFDASREHFQRSLELSPNSLSTKVLWASYWAVGTQNVAEFDRLLCEVLASDPEFEEIGPENRAEQRKALTLLEEREDLFIEVGEAPVCEIFEPAEEASTPESSDDLSTTIAQYRSQILDCYNVALAEGAGSGSVTLTFDIEANSTTNISFVGLEELGAGDSLQVCMEESVAGWQFEGFEDTNGIEVSYELNWDPTEVPDSSGDQEATETDTAE